MGLATIGLIGGIGKGINEAGNYLAKFTMELAELDKKREAQLEAIRTELGMKNQAEIDKEARIEQRLQDTAKRFEPMFGVDATPKTQADFQKPLITNEGDPYVSDVTQQDDTEKYGKYQKGQAEGRAMADLAARRPEALDDIQKAMTAKQMSGMLDDAIQSKDWTAVARISAAMKGNGPWKGMGSGLAIDEITGEVKTSGVSDSVIRENDAQAGRARSATSNDRRDGILRSYDAEVTDLRNQVQKIETEQFDQNKHGYGDEAQRKWQERHDSNLASARALLKEAETKRDAVRREVASGRGMTSTGGGSGKGAGGLDKYFKKK